MEEFYKGVSWNTQDLTGSKQAFCILAKAGVKPEVLQSLNFGNLDIASVWEELSKTNRMEEMGIHIAKTSNGIPSNYETTEEEREAMEHMNVKEWYNMCFPTDELWKDIPDYTFEDLFRKLDRQEFSYQLFAGDSVIRERILHGLAFAMGVPPEEVWAQYGQCKNTDPGKIVEVDGKPIILYNEKDFTNRFAKEFPEGLKIPVTNINMEELDIYRFYPNERWIKGMPESLQTKTDVPDNNLNVEVRLKPEDYGMIYPQSDYYYSYELGQMTGMDEETNETTMFLNTVDKLEEGFVEVYLKEERMFLEKLYVEGVQMKKAMEILLQNRKGMALGAFKEKLQLTRLMEEGIAVVEERSRLHGKAAKMVNEVRNDITHWHVGEGRKIEEHPHYETDVKPKYDRELKERAELELRKIGVIQTLPEVYDVRWKNVNGDNWECKEMTNIINKMYRGYAEKVVTAYQNGEWMRLNIFTTNPDYRKRILDAVNCSWAKEEIVPVTELQQMPEEIASAVQTAQKTKEKGLKPTFIGTTDGVYFSEKGTSGYVFVDYDRSIIQQGKPFTEKNREYLDKLVKEGNILQGTYACLKRIGERREYLDLTNRLLVVANNELVNGKRQLIDADKGNIFDADRIGYNDITGRVTDAMVYGKHDKLFLRCKIDGVQQLGQPLKTEQANAYRCSGVTAQQLAVRIHAITLFRNNISEERTMKR